MLSSSNFWQASRARSAMRLHLAARARRADHVLNEAGARELAAAGHDVLQNRHVLEDLRRLEGAHHAGAAALLHRSGGQGVASIDDSAVLLGQIPADDVEQRGLARAVRPDQPGEAALGDGEGDAAQHREAAEIVADGVEPQDVGMGRHGERPPVAAARRHSRSNALVSPPGQADHHQDESKTEQDLVEVAEPAEILRHEGDEQRPDHGAEHRAHPAQHRDQQEAE